MVNGNLIVIGGTDNQQESKLNIYSDIISIDPSTLKCTNINIKYDSGASANIKRAFHATNYIDNYLLINSGMREPDYEYQELYIDTSTWTRKFKFKNRELEPTPDSNLPDIKPTLNTSTIICSVVAKKIELGNNGSINGKINKLEPMVEWVRSDLNIIQLDNEAIFTLDDKATVRINTEADREEDLNQLNSINLAYKNNDSKQNSTSNYIHRFSRTFINSTLVNNANIDDDDTPTLAHLPKDNF
ncbi:hypothetical protein CONCODRAFT_9864 [Conidiobolus coronatus NRRL 28638]|uniref:Uncharacterized protein n=1 Tax=Conidiobolus coronatus (strain ATCC 28846 / CBS 209.66 / NRRL 28638) TaxID=796925 RepID=A0A137NYV7_CONC2|nr:hypothetical protein CONCODRAFT_9864 [Conidiobolus coronatus NRRL 28638]|eukprot:KXN67966.1 hypothetical protein CONCODRAFT_9864 [Conidiobolus coronatus NRRL 28638]